MRDRATITRISLLLSAVLTALLGTIGNSRIAFAANNFPGTTIAGSNGTFTDNNTGATGELLEPVPPGGGILGNVNTIWYSWTAPASGQFVFGTCNATASTTTNFNTTIRAYTGALVALLSAMDAGNNNTAGCDTTSAPGDGSTNSFAAVSGTTYRLQVDGAGGATGNYHLHYGLVGFVIGTADGSATEGGDTGAFTVALTTVPTANVTVTIGTSAQCTFSPTPLTFTPTNWATPQTITATATDDAVIEGTHSCTPASITATGGSFDTATGTPPTITVNDNDVASFTIAKAVDHENIATPGTLTYTVTVDNTGTVSLTGLAITDTLLQGATPRTLTTGPAYASGDTDTDGAIDPAETWIYGAAYAVTQANIDDGSTFSNTATFDTAQTTASTSPAATTTVTQSPGLTIDKSADSAGPVSVGTVITYTYVVTNTGNLTVNGTGVADAHNGYGTSPVPVGEALTSDSAPLGDSSDATPNNGTWSVLAPGDEVTFTAPYTVTQTDVDLLQ